MSTNSKMTNGHSTHIVEYIIFISRMLRFLADRIY